VFPPVAVTTVVEIGVEVEVPVDGLELEPKPAVVIGRGRDEAMTLDGDEPLTEDVASTWPDIDVGPSLIVVGIPALSTVGTDGESVGIGLSEFVVVVRGCEVAGSGEGSLVGELIASVVGDWEPRHTRNSHIPSSLLDPRTMTVTRLYSVGSIVWRIETLVPDGSASGMRSISGALLGSSTELLVSTP